jgi:hypothetical protein
LKVKNNEIVFMTKQSPNLGLKHYDSKSKHVYEGDEVENKKRMSPENDQFERSRCGYITE